MTVNLQTHTPHRITDELLPPLREVVRALRPIL
jgi:hypothetical protein